MNTTGQDISGNRKNWKRWRLRMSETSEYLEKLRSIQTPGRRRGSPKWFREGRNVASMAVQAVSEESERLGHKRNMAALQKAGERVACGAPSQKLYAEAKQAAFLEIGRQLNPETRYPGVTEVSEVG